jgi:sugar/nucleoside kinase (ribokinase family)
MKILGIGNAIVDVICKVDDQYLINNELTKSTMKLVDESEFKKLLSTLNIEETVSGGSIANSTLQSPFKQGYGEISSSGLHAQKKLINII